MEKIKGGCLCGAVRYSLSEKPIMTRACWCRVCQYFAAGSATINMVFRVEAVEINGDLSDYVSTADSGNKMHRKFCPACGVHLFSYSEQRPHLLIVRAGTLDEPDNVNVEALIWTSSAPKWAYLDPGIQHYEGQPPAPVIGNK